MIVTISKCFLLATSLVYLALAIWCSVQPAVTSKKIGFELNGGTGRSEFLTVYGGLELGLALVLMAALVRGENLANGLWINALIHGSLVAFRTAGFVLYTNIDPFTYRLAIGEWIIFLVSVALIYLQPLPAD